MVTVDLIADKRSVKFVLRSGWDEHFTATCRAIPSRRVWSDQHRGWVCIADLAAAQHILSYLPGAHWSLAAEAHLAHLRDVPQVKPAQEDVSDYKFGGQFQPYEHQKEAFARSRSQRAFALLMEQGTAKSRVIVDNSAWLFQHGEITGVLVVCPNSVKPVWPEEYKVHAPSWLSYEVAVHAPSRVAARAVEQVVTLPHSTLAVLVVNVESLSTDRGVALCERFLKSRRCLMVVDESTRIKAPSRGRTKAAIRLGALAAYRRILTGTPITQSPLDAFAQFAFLDKRLLGFSSFYSFKNRYTVTGGYMGKEVLGYRFLDELAAKIDACSYRAEKDVLDLPPKVYTKRFVELTTEQRRLYGEMLDEMLLTLDAYPKNVREYTYVDDVTLETVTATHDASTALVLTQLLRLHQIVGGFVPAAPGQVPTPVAGQNPKIAAMLESVEESRGKVIVWCRFRPEINLVAQALREAYGPDSVVEFHGGVKEDERTRGRLAFQDPGSRVRFFVGQSRTGGIGLTLTQATTVIYYSNDFSLEVRLQSEDRAHRAGQNSKVTYVDLIALDTLDEKLLAVLREKKSLANVITRDTVKEWI